MIIADCKNSKGKWLTGTLIDGKLRLTRAGVTWSNMKARCFRQSWKQHKPTYRDCSMSPEFEDFQGFAEWCQTQVGYGLEGYGLDKDILKVGNKVYSPEVCVFVPRFINSFMAFRPTKDSGLPVGATYIERLNKYNCQISHKGKKVLCKTFDTAHEAHVAYMEMKAVCAKELYEEMVDGKIIVDNRVVEFFKNWKHHYQPQEHPYD